VVVKKQMRNAATRLPLSASRLITLMETFSQHSSSCDSRDRYNVCKDALYRRCRVITGNHVISRNSVFV